MTLKDYFSSVTEDLTREAERIRIGFSTHRPVSGQGREEIVSRFLSSYIPQAFISDTGLIVSSEGVFSNQADIVVADALYNTPLYPDSTNKLWLAESIYALIEV